MTKNFQEKINFLQASGLYRQLVESDAIDAVVVKRGVHKLISFCSNDYFGLAHNVAVKKAACDAINKYGASQASSRYISGNNSFYSKLEKRIAGMKNCEEAIVFSSGYMAAIGAISALVGEGDLVVADKLIHSCLLDGIKLSGAKMIRFAHNDLAHARQILLENTKKYQKILIITEDVFSMDGDKGHIIELYKLAREFGCMMLSDGAHSLFDEEFFDGDGAQNLLDVDRRNHENKSFEKKKQSSQNKNTSHAKNIFLRMGTFSKAVGSFGGYIAGDKITIDYLRNFSKSAIYTTALPASILAASLRSLQLISKNNYAKKTLQNAQYFCDLMKLPKPQSAIVVIKIGDNKKVLQITENVAKKGFLISAIRPPTVEPKGARLRITFSTLHNKKQIKQLVLALQNFI